ncbi:hypothetical protein FOL47_002620 [Perkinsus chesapeaki]|uniref:Peptidase A1 domain-containing protein n=1 Tax=Perkinsus chesapeaki TaxID=330153 RepID=A0A7J6MD57_PERCH|nr:hypothetical protein FOL47_002620 [Perkinsus chesapeaki]
MTNFCKTPVAAVLWYTMVFLLAERVICKQLKLAISRLNTADDKVGLLTTLLADGQQQTAVVDTGGPKSFFVWKSWYEHLLGPGSCKQLLWGCYDRKLPFPKPANLEYIDFNDDSSVGIFPYSANVRFGNFAKANTKIGLVSASDPSPLQRPPHASFGLGPPREGPTRFPTFMQQLMSDPARPISGNIFALYLNQSKSAVPAGYTGYLLLGKGDPTVYQKPLKYIPLIPSTLWRVRLGFFQIGRARKTDVLGEEVVIDTGTNAMLVPQAHLESLLSSIRQHASATAGTTVSVDWYRPWGVYVFECRFLKYFPNINFGLGNAGSEVTVEIAHNAYFLGESLVRGRCVLGISAHRGSGWYLPDTSLVGNYFEFQPDNERIGYAKLKAR